MRLAGRRVRVRGVRTLDGFNASTIAAAGPATAPTAADARLRRIAVVLLHTRGSTAEPVSKDDAQRQFFGDTGSVANYFAEVSGGAENVTGKVFGWYDSGYKPSGCSNLARVLTKFLTEAARRAQVDGYRAEDYDNLVVFTPQFGGSGCNISGVGWVGQSGVLLNGAMALGPAAHELGHNLGLSHAGSLACNGESYGARCQRDDYGDPFDVMGHAWDNHAYNAVHKYYVGWLPADEVQSVDTGHATISLSSSEKPEPGTTELALVNTSTGIEFAVERRAPYGEFDQGVSGVWVRVVGAPNSPSMGTDDTQLLDMTPDTPDITDGSLAPGATFVDPTSGATITNTGDDGTTATIAVCVTDCGVGTTTTTTDESSSTTTTEQPQAQAIEIAVRRNVMYIAGTSGDDVLRLGRDHNFLTVDTNGAPTLAGPGCSYNGDVVRCRARAFNVKLGDGNDAVTVDGRTRATLDGGAGDDVLRGGTGGDVFIGGDGDDTVSYLDRAPAP